HSRSSGGAARGGSLRWARLRANESRGGGRHARLRHVRRDARAHLFQIHSSGPPRRRRRAHLARHDAHFRRQCAGAHRALSRGPRVFPRMTPAARLSAAIEVLADIDARRRPATDALKDWGLAHRFAGSGDRAAIAGLTYDALRRRASCAHVMGEASPRALVLAMLRLERKLGPDAIARLADGARFAPAPLSEEERARLAAGNLDDAPAWVAGDYPEWLDPQL